MTPVFFSPFIYSIFSILDKAPYFSDTMLSQIDIFESLEKNKEVFVLSVTDDDMVDVDKLVVKMEVPSDMFNFDDRTCKLSIVTACPAESRATEGRLWIEYRV